MRSYGRQGSRLRRVVASLHSSDEMLKYTKVIGARDRWESSRGSIAATVDRARALEKELNASGWAGSKAEDTLGELHRCYRAIFDAFYAKGVSEAVDSNAPVGDAAPQAGIRALPVDQAESVTPTLSVVIPVWSRTPELADMARRTIERVWSVSQVPTEVIVIDNGSPHTIPLQAIVHRFAENRGVATAWNVGASLASAPVLAFLNSDCLVEKGWDVALIEAATTGRRVGFPYTDHGDDQGFRQPDQGGTAGWCFVLTAQLFGEVGPFDERFNPAFCEDTDYWHRAWEMGI